MFGKLIDGVIEYAPKTITIDSGIICNPTDAQLAEAGYKPVIEGDVPTYSARQKIITTYSESASEINITYSAAELTAEELEAKYNAAVQERIHALYSYDDEIKLINLGVGDSADAEYAAYRVFVAQTKTAVKEELGIADS